MSDLGHNEVVRESQVSMSTIQVQTKGIHKLQNWLVWLGTYFAQFMLVELCFNCDICAVRYSGHLNSRLMGLLVNMTKQGAFPSVKGAKKL